MRRFKEWLLRGLTLESESLESDDDGFELLANDESNTDESESADDSNSSNGHSDYYQCYRHSIEPALQAVKMIYLSEPRYFENIDNFPLRHALTVTARTVARWCTHFEAQLIVPFYRPPDRWERIGRLPADLKERDHFVAELVDWLFENSAIEELFCLMLDDEPLPKQGRAKTAKFDHHDDTCCWGLNLSEEEFSQLRLSWLENYLPEDLFYPEHR